MMSFDQYMDMLEEDRQMRKMRKQERKAQGWKKYSRKKGKFIRLVRPYEEKFSFLDDEDLP